MLRATGKEETDVMKRLLTWWKKKEKKTETAKTKTKTRSPRQGQRKANGENNQSSTMRSTIAWCT
ncbi:hypothetical protein HO173_008890 [Letharia columbiana]|uniref:Uncharacterized protein n=1 Tax=Letharia columbiana TaxID=112416 RepID=A0A8H6FQP7_9LECA|nr:uncharacterized protein HO173_008890 [Letharia columbiana]KAF6232927.1 hypothetical protein HO173_008890 [Letharia columbiana]